MKLKGIITITKRNEEDYWVDTFYNVYRYISNPQSNLNKSVELRLLKDFSHLIIILRYYVNNQIRENLQVGLLF